MATATELCSVLTFPEAAQYLRISEDKLKSLTDRNAVPGREIDGEWRFSRAALDEWLKGPSPKELLLSQAGAFAENPGDMESLRQQLEDNRARDESSRAG